LGINLVATEVEALLDAEVFAEVRQEAEVGVEAGHVAETVRGLSRKDVAVDVAGAGGEGIEAVTGVGGAPAFIGGDGGAVGAGEDGEADGGADVDGST